MVHWPSGPILRLHIGADLALGVPGGHLGPDQARDEQHVHTD